MMFEVTGLYVDIMSAYPRRVLYEIILLLVKAHFLYFSAFFPAMTHMPFPVLRQEEFLRKKLDKKREDESR